MFGVALPQGVLIGSARSIDPRHSGPQTVAIIVVLLLLLLSEKRKVSETTTAPNVQTDSYFLY